MVLDCKPTRPVESTLVSTEQETHWLWAMLPGSDAVPGGHAVQLAAPCVAYVLLGHAEQGAEPPGDDVPAGQSWQPFAPHAPGLLPAGQFVLAPVQPAESTDSLAASTPGVPTRLGDGMLPAHTKARSPHQCCRLGLHCRWRLRQQTKAHA